MEATEWLGDYSNKPGERSWWLGLRTVFVEGVRRSRLSKHHEDETDKISDGFYVGRKKSFKRNEE